MPLRWVAAGTLVVALFTGCSSAPPRWSSSRPSAAADRERWNRAACRLGMYPEEIDGRALARARFDEIRARQNGSVETLEASRILRERDAFDSRCTAWRESTEDRVLLGQVGPRVQ